MQYSPRHSSRFSICFARDLATLCLCVTLTQQDRTEQKQSHNRPPAVCQLGRRVKNFQRPTTTTKHTGGLGVTTPETYITALHDTTILLLLMLLISPPLLLLLLANAAASDAGLLLSPIRSSSSTDLQQSCLCCLSVPGAYSSRQKMVTGMIHFRPYASETSGSRSLTDRLFCHHVGGGSLRAAAARHGGGGRISEVVTTLARTGSLLGWGFGIHISFYCSDLPSERRL